MSQLNLPVDNGSNDTSKCPLCGGANNCALGKDPDATECWCDFELIPRELLTQIPSHVIHHRCICKLCLEEHLKSTIAPDGAQ